MPRSISRDLVLVAATALTTALLMPVASDAAGSVFALRDGHHSNRTATVSKTGQLKVGDGKGALTVDGKVQADTLLPGTPWDTVNGVGVTGASPTANLYSGSGSTRLYLSSFTASATASSAGSVGVHLGVYVHEGPGGSCATLDDYGAAERFNIQVPVGQTVHLAYPYPLVFSQYASGNDSVCINVQGSGGPAGWNVSINAQGYVK